MCIVVGLACVEVFNIITNLFTMNIYKNPKILLLNIFFLEYFILFFYYYNYLINHYLFQLKYPYKDHQLFF